MKIKVLKVFQLIILFLQFTNYFIFSYKNDSKIKINTKHSAVKVSEEVIFTWENADLKDIDPKITFWDYNSSPEIDKNFIEGSWKYLNEQSPFSKSTINPAGSIRIKAPDQDGLYKVFYCYTRFIVFKCKFVRVLAVITCQNQNSFKPSNIYIDEVIPFKENSFENLNQKGKIIKDKKISEINFKTNFFLKNIKPFSITNNIINLLNHKNIQDTTPDTKPEDIRENSQKISRSNVEHIIIFISENHSFDSIYGKYCKAKPFSNPKCNYGPECCEAAPLKVNNIKPVILTDTQNSIFDPCHNAECENSEMNGGKMDKFLINGIGSDPKNFAVAVDDYFSAKHYFNFARNGAIGDNFFQSSSGASCQNNMYFATAKYLFRDNNKLPQGNHINGAKCFKKSSNYFHSFYDPTIADLLNVCNISWTFYAEGYKEKPVPGECYPYFYDASDNPFSYFPSLTESPNANYNFRDFSHLIEDIKNNKLPAVSYVKALGIHSEHPEHSGSFITGQMMSNQIYEEIMKSEIYSKNTVLFLLPDESGGFYDHKKPPNVNQIDGNQYGPRTQFIALGDLVKKNYVSHVLMESSSLIRFIEWNWFGKEGLLWARDLLVNNIGDIFDEEKIGVSVPSINNKSFEDIKGKYSRRKERISDLNRNIKKKIELNRKERTKDYQDKELNKATEKNINTKSLTKREKYSRSNLKKHN